MDLEIVDVQVKGCTYMDIYIYIFVYIHYTYIIHVRRVLLHAKVRACVFKMEINGLCLSLFGYRIG